MPVAVGSEHLIDAAARVWRAVEAQHEVSTMRLVGGDRDDQMLLEAILEESKPPLPASAAGLHWLLSTPFRYPPRAGGSRFRGPADPGVFYGAREQRTACAEAGYWRWRFVIESHGLRESGGLLGLAMSLFEARLNTRWIDLMRAPFVTDRPAWTHPDDYGATQALARQARSCGAGAIAYESVRDPEHGGCAAVLQPSAFVPGQSPRPQGWFLTVTPATTVWQRERASYSFRWAASPMPSPHRDPG